MRNPQQLLTITDVTDRIRCCRGNIYKLLKQNAFPRAVKIGTRGVRWVEAEIEEWISTRPRTSNDDE